MRCAVWNSRRWGSAPCGCYNGSQQPKLEERVRVDVNAAVCADSKVNVLSFASACRRSSIGFSKRDGADGGASVAA